LPPNAEREKVYTYFLTFLVEILDTVNLQPVNSGEYDEIVLTSLTSEAMPFIRYRLGDIAIILP